MSYLSFAFKTFSVTVFRHVDVPSIGPAFLHVQDHSRNQQRIVEVWMNSFNLCWPWSHVCIVSCCEKIVSHCQNDGFVAGYRTYLFPRSVLVSRREFRFLVASTYLHIERCLLLL